MTTPTISQIPSTADWLLMSADFPESTPEDLFDYFTEPDLLPKWWCQEVPTLDLSVGGKYHLSWSAMNWHLRGSYKAVEVGKVVAFTWKWDHEPDLPTRKVCVMFNHGQSGGTSLMIIHGTYGESEIEQNDRKSHLDGWTHFLGQLGAVMA